MSILEYKRLSIVLASLVIVLLGLLLSMSFKHGIARLDVKRANDKIDWFERMRASASKSDLQFGVQCLQDVAVLHNPTNGYHRLSLMDDLVERERQRAIRDIIAVLRTKTGANLGDDPQKWIQQYGQ